jgi:hypothetical protein
MKKVLTLLFMVLCSGLYAQKDKSYHNHRHEAGIDDFRSATAEFQYSEKGKFTYCISNDKENFYVNLRFIEKDVIRQILGSGVTVWINTDGKTLKKMGVRYPVRSQKPEKGGETGNRNMQNPPEMQNSQNAQGNRNMPQNGAVQGQIGNIQDMNLMDAAMIELIGFSEPGSKIISNLESGSFKGSLRMEKNGNLLYELIMPFSKLPTINDQPGKKNISPFILGISYQSVPTMGGPSGGAPGGGGGMSGGGRGMSGGGGGRPGGNSGGGPGPSQG